MDVTPLLMNCMSHDQTTRQAAEQQIEQAKASNLVRQPAPSLPSPLRAAPDAPRPWQPLLMSLMATELANEQKDMVVRQAAGLVLKNCLTAKVPRQHADAPAPPSACCGPRHLCLHRPCLPPELRPSAAQDETSQQELSAKWLQMDGAAKQQIKATVRALGPTPALAAHHCR